ncbi:MAG: SIS domain-containing protein, partial [Pseudobdellovibrionaceae bacterium]
EIAARFEDSGFQSQFAKSCELLFACRGKVVVTGIGKSGHIGRKFASTLSSTGTPAVFLHPAESSHGDLGIVDKEDLVIAISYGGEAGELVNILSYCARKKIPVVGLTGQLKSNLASQSTCVLNVKISEEACPLKLAPTSSSTATLVVCDALAMTVLEMRGFQATQFAEFHPGGNLGARLLTKVKDIMHQGEALPLVSLKTSVKDVLSQMTQKDVRGAAGVMNDQGHLVGVVTDGDLRRRLEKNQDPLVGVAEELMSHHPRTIDAEELAEKALFVMEEFKIQLLFVLDKSSVHPRKPVGLIHIQDLLKAKIR